MSRLVIISFLLAAGLVYHQVRPSSSDELSRATGPKIKVSSKTELISGEEGERDKLRVLLSVNPVPGFKLVEIKEAPWALSYLNQLPRGLELPSSKQIQFHSEIPGFRFTGRVSDEKKFQVGGDRLDLEVRGFVCLETGTQCFMSRAPVQIDTSSILGAR